MFFIRSVQILGLCSWSGQYRSMFFIRSVQVYVLVHVSTGLCSWLGQYRSMFLIKSVQVYVLVQISTGLCSWSDQSGLCSWLYQYRSMFSPSDVLVPRCCFLRSVVEWCFTCTETECCCQSLRFSVDGNGTEWGSWRLTDNLIMHDACVTFSFIHYNEYNTIIEHVSTHLFQRWITDIFQCACTGFAYIMSQKAQVHRQVFALHHAFCLIWCFFLSFFSFFFSFFLVFLISFHLFHASFHLRGCEPL